MSLADMLGGPNLGEEDEDEAMDGDASSNGSGGSGVSEDEGEGVDLRNDSGQGDSSEEEDEGSDAEREVRAGFIVDEDESSSKKKKRRKHKREGGEGGSKRRRKDSDDDGGDLDEDDLMLMEENTGKKLGASRPQSSSGKLKRLRRHRSASVGSDTPEKQGLDNLFDDDRQVVGARPDMFDEDEMAGFIEDDTASDSSGGGGGRRGGRGGADDSDSGSEDENDRAARKAKRKAEKAKKKKEARANRGSGGRRTGGFGIGNDTFSAETWSDVTDVFGNGQDYAFAMEDDADLHEGKELADIFEPSEMAARLLTDADNLIRDLDIPERLQLASAGLPSFPPIDGAPAPYISEDDLSEATQWMSTRISARCTEEYVIKDEDNNRPTLYPLYLEAVQNAIKFINIEFLEVPFIYHHRSDFLVHYDQNNPDPRNRNIALLNQEDLWNMSALCIKYRALNYRRSELRKLWDELEDVEDDYFETLYQNLESVEEVADLNEWVAMKYATQVMDLKDKRERESADGVVKKIKRATRESGYLNAKKSVVTKLADQMAVTATQLAEDFISLNKTHFADDPSLAPLELAEQFAGGEYNTAVVALSTAKMILVTEISKDPQIKKEIRKYFKDNARVSVKPTDKGVTKIDEQNPYYAFKYLQNKPLKSFARTSQFLEICAAENDGLVKSTLSLPEESSAKLLEDLQKLYHSDLTSSLAVAWNDLRTEILQDAIDLYLIPAAEAWARNTLKDEQEEFVGNKCAAALQNKIDVAAYRRDDDSQYEGEPPSVLAISHGGGDPKRDSIIAVFLDAEGHFREHIKMDDLGPNSAERDPVQRQAFVDLLRNRRPQVIVVGGFSPSTKRLLGDIQSVADEVSAEIVDKEEDDDEGEEWDAEMRAKKAKFEITLVYDDVARIYQNSKRAATEFAELSKLGRYCVGLARYAQSPLNEYAALGADIGAISFDPNQKLLNPEKVLLHLERALVEVVNKVGVDVNRAIRNPYYYHLLPYVSGLGPRKANRVAQKAIGLGGTLTCRSNLVVSEMMTKNIFMNSSAFLRIAQDELAADLKRSSEEADVLDDTRIHPEDYEIARKMAADAMEYDEDDIDSNKVASQAVIDVMEDDTTAKKLDDLSLDDFASELFKILEVPKRLTLYGIRSEMQQPYSERRAPFTIPNASEIFTMLTGETEATLDRGLIVPVKVSRIRQDGGILVRLDSGIEGTISVGYFDQKPRLGETLQALVMNVKYEEFSVELSAKAEDTDLGDTQFRAIPTDTFFNQAEAAREQADKAIASMRSGRQKRLVNHPNFHNQDAGEAEHYLRSLQRGDCVIRPSSKDDHLAITWKVDDGVFQHIAVTELDKASEFAIGSKLLIENGKYTYTDLDEVIEMHVKQMARKVEEMMRNDKYRGTQDSLNQYLKNHTAANPGSSAYGFGLDRSDPKHAGQFVVSFRASDKAPIQSWPIKVVPGAFSLLGEDHGDVAALCNAFKTAYANRVVSDARGPAKTPHHLGGRTPSHLPGGRTPAHLAGGRTPIPKTANPYGNSPAALIHGRATPNAGRSTPRSGLSGGASPYPQTAFSNIPNPNIPQRLPPPPPPPQQQQQQQYPNNNNYNNNNNQWNGQRQNY